MKRVTGLGGVFFKCQDKERTLAWYRDHLGIEPTAWGGVIFEWGGPGSEAGQTVWSPFAADTNHFEPSSSELMLNYRVADLDALVTALRAEGVELVGEPISETHGKFAWVMDPDGRKVELWEPPASDE
ncbi:MAG: VOC family protein [Planctomycetota bacterium]